MLQAFRSLPVAREVYRSDDLPPQARAYAHDTLTLGWEERLRARARRRSDGGLEFGTALDRGTVLRAGDCLVIDQLTTVVRVVEQSEPVLVVTPRAPREWALVGYHIGNGHQPVMITADAIVCPDRPGMAELLDYHRIGYTRARLPFTPATADIPAHPHQR